MREIPFTTAADHARYAVEVGAHLRRAGLIAYPTETVYGLGCALVSGAPGRLARLKGREAEKPLLLLVSDREQVPGLAWTAAARRLADAFWPGPLTVALAAEPGRYPAEVVGTAGLIAVRATSHAGVRRLIEELGAPITSTSANRAGEPAARTADEARAVVRALGDPPELWLLDGGELPPSPPSTLVDCSAEEPRVIRSGAVKLEQLRSVVPSTHEGA